MIKKYVFIVVLLLLSSIVFSVESDYVVVNFPEPEQELIDYIISEGYEIISLKPEEHLHVIAGEDKLSGFETLGYNFEILFTESEMRNNLRLRTRELPGYRSYDMMLGELTTISQENPDLALLYNIGDSRGKEYFTAGNLTYEDFAHDIWALKVTANPAVESDKPAVYYSGGQHAREPISMEMIMLILWHLIDNYGIDPEITYLVDNTEVWFIPLMNPDGHKIVIDQVNTNWRKNIRDNGNTGYINSNDGVDINRNYTHEWQLGSSQSSSTYGGPSPSSEPETSALRTLWGERHFVAGISYHSYGQWVLYPPGYDWYLVSPDVLAQSALAQTMAATIPRLSGTGHYTAQHSWQLYPANGTCEDDAYCNFGIFAHTLEMATVFIPPPTQMQQICEDNLEAALILLRRVHHSTLTGIITDFATEEPLIAEVFIPGIDDTGVWRTPYLSSEEYGRYFRLLVPADYEVQFSAPGYHSSPLFSFTINDSVQTQLDYEMVPLALTAPLIRDVFGTDEFAGLTWELPYPESNPDGYRIYRDGILLNPGNLVIHRAYLDFDIVPGEFYIYQVSAVFSGGESDLSQSVIFTSAGDSLEETEDVTVLFIEDSVFLQWSPVANASGYLIFTADNPYAEQWSLLDYTPEIEFRTAIKLPRAFYFVKSLVTAPDE